MHWCFGIISFIITDAASNIDNELIRLLAIIRAAMSQQEAHASSCPCTYTPSVDLRPPTLHWLALVTGPGGNLQRHTRAANEKMHYAKKHVLDHVHNCALYTGCQEKARRINPNTFVNTVSYGGHTHLPFPWHAAEEGSRIVIRCQLHHAIHTDLQTYYMSILYDFIYNIK
jgi:hypothetical protein